jgi:outer membrane autotransporter protein
MGAIVTINLNYYFRHDVVKKAKCEAYFKAKLNRQAILKSIILSAIPLLTGHEAFAADPCAANITIASDECYITASIPAVTVETTGSILASTGPALTAGFSALEFTITNMGTIDGGKVGSAISSYGPIGELTNSGTITANGNYVISGGNIFNINAIDNQGSIRTLTNESTGVIENLNGTAIYNTGSIESLINKGTIKASSGQFFAIDNYGLITNGIINTGLIDGNVNLGSSTLYLNGTTGRVTGGIGSESESAGIVVNGTFTQEAGFSVKTLKINSEGQLTLSENYIAANMTNNGRVIINAGTQAIIAEGNYTQSATGVLEIGVNSGTSSALASDAGNSLKYGTLYVDGTATFDAGTGIYVNTVGVDSILKNNIILSSVVSAGNGIDATTFNVTDNSKLFNFEALVNTSSIDLLAIAASTSGVSSSALNQGFSQGLGAARVLDGFVNDSNTSGDMANVVTALGKLSTDRAVSDAVAQTLPLMSAGLNQVTSSTMRTTNRVIQARQEGNMGRSSGDDFLGDKHFWFKPVASRADQDNRDGVAGYTADTYGMVFGADAEVSERDRLGFAFSYMSSNVDGRSTASTNSADIDAYQLVSYGSHQFAAAPDIEVNWQADVGTNKNDGRRKINFGGLDRVAKSDFDSTTAHVGAGISRSLQLNERTRFIPSVRADYFWIRDEAYTEKGADALNLHVKRNSSDQLIAMAEGKVCQQLTDRASLSVNGGIGYDLLNERDSITASYAGGGSAFRTKGMDLSPWMGRAGLGLTVNATERTEITARYDLEGRSDFIGQTASVKVRWSF